MRERFSTRQGTRRDACLDAALLPGTSLRSRASLGSREQVPTHVGTQGAEEPGEEPALPAGAGKPPKGTAFIIHSRSRAGGGFGRTEVNAHVPHTHFFHRHPMKQSLPSACLPTAANFLREDLPSLGPRSGRQAPSGHQAPGSSFALLHRGAQETGPRILKCTGSLPRKARGRRPGTCPKEKFGGSPQLSSYPQVTWTST